LVWKKKQNLTQQKHTFTNQKKYTTEQNQHKKTKARFSHLLRHPAWKWRGPILTSALHEFVTYLLTHLLTAQEPTRGKPIWILTKQEMVGWQRHQLDHMHIICICCSVLQVTTAETRAKNSLMVSVTQKLRSAIPGHIVVGPMKAVIKIYSLGAGWHTQLSTLERRELITR